MQLQQVIAAAPAYLRGRVQQDAPLPMVELKPMRMRPRQWEEKARATAAFVLGLEEGGVDYQGLPRELFKELLGYMVHTQGANKEA